jgi:phage shock protein PspC (stress-responsive transcriptional regulator)
MKKVININLSGRVIPIEESAFQILQSYIDALRNHFNGEEGRDEIINDIQDRIAELLEQEIKKGSPCITDQKINETIGIMGKVEDFVKLDEREESHTNTTTTEKEITRSGLFRNENDKVLGGVCSGIAHALKIDPVVLRILFVLFVLGWGTGILIYIILWLVLPKKSLTNNIRKKFFRNPEGKVLGGVAGGLAAYFNIPVWIPRIIFLLPLISALFPNELPFIIIGGGFGGTFFITYLLIWMFVPLAQTSSEKMQMRGDKIDINSIKASVKEEMNQLKSRSENIGEKISTGAAQITSEVTQQPRYRFLHIIGTLLKVFVLFIAGIFALSGMIIAGALLLVAFVSYPAHDFIFNTDVQKISFWGTLFFFVCIPIIALVIGLIRTIIGARRNKYLSLSLAALWFIGWIALFLFASSLAGEFKYEKSVQTNITGNIADSATLLVTSPSKPIASSDTYWWLDMNEEGFDITNDSMRYNNVALQISKSNDSAYSINIMKYSRGKSKKLAEEKAEKISFDVAIQDSILMLDNGISIDKKSAFRGQRVVVEIKVPVGRKIIFDKNLEENFEAFDIEIDESGKRRKTIIIGHDFEYEPGVEYIMTEDGLKILNGEEKQEKVQVATEIVADKPSFSIVNFPA